MATAADFFVCSLAKIGLCHTSPSYHQHKQTVLCKA